LGVPGAWVTRILAVKFRVHVASYQRRHAQFLPLPQSFDYPFKVRYLRVQVELGVAIAKRDAFFQVG
jgi:hypothetical protein